MNNLKKNIAKIKSNLGRLTLDYEDKAVFVEYEILRLEKTRLEKILEYFVAELSSIEIGEHGIAGKTAEEKALIEWVLIIFNRIEYPSAVPALFELFEKYEKQNFPAGWSDRSALYRALMKQNTTDSNEFLREKLATETVEYLKDQLTDHLRNVSKH